VTMMRWPVRMRRLVLLGFACLVVVGLVAYAVRTGIQRIYPTGHRPGATGRVVSASSSLWSIVTLALAAGLVAYATVELLKRLTNVRRYFNLGRVSRAFPSLVERPYDRHRDGEWWNRGVELPYSGTISQLTAQIGSILRGELATVFDESEPQDRRIEAAVRIRELDRWADYHDGPYGRDSNEVLFRRLSEESTTTERALVTMVEFHLDTFLIEATRAWRLQMRTLAALIAAVVTALAAWAITSAFSAIFVAAIFGFVVGGPASWVIRDLARVAERKAEF
jgi:hypothetical protein